MKINSLLICLFFLLSAFSCTVTNGQKVTASTSDQNLDTYATAYIASGCFWCVEAVYESVEGVAEVLSGYAGGHTTDPTYKSIGTGSTGHAETVKVFYDPDRVSFETLVHVYFNSGNPTTPNQNGPDKGTQYRSILFYQSAEEKATIERIISEYQKEYEAAIVTEVTPYEMFYEAEAYHQNYERLNPDNPYVKAVSIPRLKRFQAKMPEILK